MGFHAVDFPVPREGTVLLARPVRSRPVFTPMMIHRFRCAIRRGGFASYRHHFRDGDVVRRDPDRAGSIRDGVVRRVLIVVELVLAPIRRRRARCLDPHFEGHPPLLLNGRGHSLDPFLDPRRRPALRQPFSSLA